MIFNVEDFRDVFKNDIYIYSEKLLELYTQYLIEKLYLGISYEFEYLSFMKRKNEDLQKFSNGA